MKRKKSKHEFEVKDAIEVSAGGQKVKVEYD